MKQIDNKKMWESIMEHVPSGWMRDAIRNALKDQGLKYKDGKIVSIQPDSQRMTSEETKEALLPDGLTDFEKCFQGMCHEENQKFAKACCVSLMALARKQIASEIDMDAMVKRREDLLIAQRPSFVSDVNATLRAAGFAALYRQGIEDTLKAIEKGK